MRLLLSANQVFAYIDPGTAGYIFSSLAYLLGILGAALGFAIWPIRRVAKHLNDRWHQERKVLVFFISGVTTLVFLGLVAGVCLLLFF